MIIEMNGLNFSNQSDMPHNETEQVNFFKF
jgi:hypothetical protein